MKYCLLFVSSLVLAAATSSACMIDSLNAGNDSLFVSVLPGETETVSSGYAHGFDIPGGTRQLWLSAASPAVGLGGTASIEVSGGRLRLDSTGDCDMLGCLIYDSGGTGFRWTVGALWEFASLHGVSSTHGFECTVTLKTYSGFEDVRTTTVPAGVLLSFPLAVPWADPWDIAELKVCFDPPPESSLSINQIGIPEPASAWMFAGLCLLAVAFGKRRWFP